jgi:hypothetical protein
VCDTFSYVEHDTGRASRCVQTQYRRRSKEQSRDAHGFKKNLGHLIAILAMVERSLRDEQRMLFLFGIQTLFRVNVLNREKWKDFSKKKNNGTNPLPAQPDTN